MHDEKEEMEFNLHSFVFHLASTKSCVVRTNFVIQFRQFVTESKQL